MDTTMKIDQFSACGHRLPRLQGDTGAYFRTVHTSSYPRARNPNVIVMVSGSLDWIREDSGQVIYTLKPGDTGDKLPDPQQGNYRFVAKTPVSYYCVSRKDDKVPVHHTQPLPANARAIVPQCGIAILISGSVTANGTQVSTPGSVIHALSADATIIAQADSQLEVFLP